MIELSSFTIRYALASAIIAIFLIPPVFANSDHVSLTEQEAVDRIMFVEEIQRWASEIGHEGIQVVVQKEQQPRPDCSGKNCLWCFRLLEEHQTHRATFGQYCIDANMHQISRMNIVTEQLEPVSTVIPLSTEKVLAVIPKYMFGWMKWRDSYDKSISITIHWQSRRSQGNKALFSGTVNYKEQAGPETDALMFMVIDVDTREVILTETATKDQKNFDADGSFNGKLQADLLTIVGTWSKPGYKRIADFSIFEMYNEE